MKSIDTVKSIKRPLKSTERAPVNILGIIYKQIQTRCLNRKN
jgi:hypothetical protein